MQIEKNTKIGELLEQAPEKADILIEAGMHCLGCPASQMETIEEACQVHGIDVEEIIEKLNSKNEEEEQKYIKLKLYKKEECKKVIIQNKKNIKVIIFQNYNTIFSNL